MIEDDNSELEKDKGAGLGTVAAIVGALVIISLIAANTTRININFVVYKAHNVPLWWYTVIIIALTIITDRVVRFVTRRLRMRKRKKSVSRPGGTSQAVAVLHHRQSQPHHHQPICVDETTHCDVLACAVSCQ